MHHRIYVGPFDAVDVLGVTVEHGEQIEVTAEEAASLDQQPANWAKPTTKRGKTAAANPAPAVETPPLQPPPVGETDDAGDEQTPAQHDASPSDEGDRSDDGQEADQ